MSQQSNNTTDASLHDRFEDGTLARFERNRYFNGKLMTARDMRTEQRYHAQRLHAVTRGVAGEGIVEKLDVTVSGGEESLTVDISEGVAIDRYGRPVVVPQDRTITETSTDVLNADRVSVYIEWDECVTETVPTSGTESACEDDCTYNRFLEVYEPDVRPAEDDDSWKGVPELEFPAMADFESIERREAPAADDPELATIASTYDGHGGSRSDEEIFLGTFVYDGDEEDDEWIRDESDPRSRVYSNDLLYAATARHAADFRNPHQVTLETKPADVGGARIRVMDDESDAPDVTLVSDDGTVSVEHLSGQSIDLSVEDYVTEIEDELSDEIIDIADDVDSLDSDFESLSVSVGDIDDRVTAIEDEPHEEIVARLTAQERHAAERALKDTGTTYKSAADRFPAFRDEALNVALLARDAVDARLGLDDEDTAVEESPFSRSNDAYTELFEKLRTEQIGFAEAIAEDATERSFKRLRNALDRLEDAIESEETRRLAAAQDDICHATEWLAVDDGTRFQPGTRVVDREDDHPDVGVVLRELSVRIEDWKVYADETVADQNPERYADEPVVIVSFENILEEEWGAWEDSDPADLFEGVKERGIKFHAFPRSRLTPASSHDDH